MDDAAEFKRDKWGQASHFKLSSTYLDDGSLPTPD